MKRQTGFLVGACLAGLVLGGVTVGAVPHDSIAAPRTETATFALG